MRTGPSHGPRRARSGARRPFDDDGQGALDRWVRVTCPACGVVRVRIEEVVLRNCVDDNSWSYRARCARCGSLFLASTPGSLALPAIAAGVTVEQWTLPTPSGRRGGEPIREVEAIELHLALMRPDWVDELTRGIAPE